MSGVTDGVAPREVVAGELRLAEHLVRLLGRRWTIPVLAKLASGDYQYHDLLAEIEGISAKVLTETLRRSERDGLIARRLDVRQVKTATVYQLTDLARSLEAPLAGLGGWVSENWAHVETARRRWDRRVGGS